MILPCPNTGKTRFSFANPLYFSKIFMGISNSFTWNGMPVFWRDMQIHRLPSSSVTMSFHVSFFKSTYEMPVNEAKTNKSRMKHWLCDSNGVEISRSNSSLVSYPGNGSARAHMASHPLLYNVRSLDKFCHLQSPAFFFLLSWSLHASLHSYHMVFPVFNNDSSSAPR